MSIRVAIIGAGAAGLITGKTFLEDGFHVQLFTRDSSVGGTWAKERVYPGLYLNNVHGEYRFSSLPMPGPTDSGNSDGRLNGRSMQEYFETFASKFLGGRIQFDAEVLNIRRGPGGDWAVTLKNTKTEKEEILSFDKIVLCTGGCSNAQIPDLLSPSAAQNTGFKGCVFHSSQFKQNMERVDGKNEQDGSVLVVGGGKSAQDITAYAVTKGRKVTMVFSKADAFIAAPVRLPDFLRKSRFLPILSPHIHLRTRLEKFLHQTKLGSLLVHSFWKFISWSSYDTFSIPPSSPFRRTYSNFWEIRTNDEGSKSLSGFFDHLKQGKINVVAPARALCYSDDGLGVLLDDGRKIEASTVILATGYRSSWDDLLSEETRQELGLSRQGLRSFPDIWNYTSLDHPPIAHTTEPRAAASLYRGIVPVQNLLNGDFAVNGSIFTINNGYTFEVVSHWISSYFLKDSFLRLPSSAEGALMETQMNASWLRKRYPGIFSWVNESYSSNVAFFSYPQLCDDLLEDMGLDIMRSGGNTFSWPFKVIDLKEIENLHFERFEKRNFPRASQVFDSSKI